MNVTIDKDLLERLIWHAEHDIRAETYKSDMDAAKAVLKSPPTTDGSGFLWTPCSERLPEAGQRVVILRHYEPEIAWIDGNGEWRWHWGSIVDPDFWCALPPLPTKGDGQ